MIIRPQNIVAMVKQTLFTISSINQLLDNLDNLHFIVYEVVDLKKTCNSKFIQRHAGLLIENGNVVR